MSNKIDIAVMLFFVFSATLFLGVKVQPAKAQELPTIYIRADGSVDPPDAPIATTDNITYTITEDITTLYGENGIVVERDNIIVDGAGHALYGFGWIEGNNGVEVYGRTNVTVTNITIPNIGYDSGIYLDASSSCSVHDVYSDTHRAILLSGCTYCGVFNCTTDAVYLFGSDYNDVYDNVFLPYGFGMWMTYSSHNSILRNNMTENTYNIWLEMSSNNIFRYNDIAHSERGIWVDESFYNDISRNNFTENEVGFLMINSFGNHVYQNNIVNNTQQVQSTNSTNVWDDGYPAGGNFWSDYNGTDSNGDGIGDTPYVIDENNRDNYPIMGPFPFLPWDLTGDGYVGIDDILEAAQAFGSTPELPRWNPEADLNHDNYVGIDDILSIARNFGRTSPP